MASALAPHFSFATEATALFSALAFSLVGAIGKAAENLGSSPALTDFGSNNAGNAKRTLTNFTFMVILLV